MRIVIPATICMLWFFQLSAAFTTEPAFELEGAFDYFIVSKSLLADNMAQDYESDGHVHQGDTSLGVEGTTAKLNADDIPPDALIEKALLIWVVSKDSANKNANADNSVVLVSPDGVDHPVAATKQGNGATAPSLEFEAYYKTGYYYYLYRVDVTDTVKSFQTGDGTDQKSLAGDWLVKGVDDIYDCIKDKNHAYCSSASMVGSWQLILIYSSKEIARKRLYFYHGMDWSSSTTMKPLTVSVRNFELPEAAAVKISFVTSDGDDVDSAKEFLKIKGNLAQTPLVLADKCNPPDLPFNNKFLNYNYKNLPTAECITEISYDIDTFLLQYDENDTSGLINEHIKFGTTSFDFMIGTGSDIVLTNYVMVSVDTKLPAFDIPMMDEKSYITQATIPDAVCNNRPFAYEIIIENHGQEPATAVMVKDAIPNGLKYIPGSTQIDRKGDRACFETLADSGGESPLVQGLLVADTMGICHDRATDCPRAIVRFKAEPVDPPKHAVYLNTAYIWDTKSGQANAYKTNQAIPVRTKVDFSCPEVITDPYAGYTECSGETPDTEPIQPDKSADNDADDPQGGDTGKVKDTEPTADTDAILVEEDEGCGCSMVR